jgi:hypothetical protein
MIRHQNVSTSTCGDAFDPPAVIKYLKESIVRENIDRHLAYTGQSVGRVADSITERKDLRLSRSSL